MAPQGWNALVGPLTVACVLLFLSRAEQGFYYSFASVLALRSVVDLGLGSVLAYSVSHEAAGLATTDKRRAADHRGRIAAMTAFATRWYSAAAVVLACGLLVVGGIIFSTSGARSVSWRGPWLVLVGLEACSLLLVPVMATLEGLGQVAWVARLRAIQALTEDVAIWVALAVGGALWALPAGALVSVVAGVCLLAWQRSGLLHAIRREPSVPFSWRAEVWPFQWRSAVSTAAGYLSVEILVPLLLVVSGPVEAGRLGLSMTIGTAILSGAMAWMQTKRPAMAMLAARRDYRGLDRMFFPAMVRSMSLTALGCAVFLAAVTLLYRSHSAWSQRLLGPGATALLCAGVLCLQLQWAQSAYLRAHKREMFVPVRLACAVVTVPLGAWLGWRYGGLGIMLAFAAVSSTISLVGGTYLFVKLRSQWHAAPGGVRPGLR